MGIKVAINGYGRIGRQVLRAIYDYNLQDQLEVVAVNASGSLETNAHLTKFDTVHGRFDADISHDATHLIINGRKIPFFSTRNPAELPWRDLGVDLVMECTGSFTSKSKANVHLESGAKKVLISAPGEADVDATIVYGVNDDVITDDMTVISNASCTTNCLAPMAAVLQKEFGVVEGLMTTIHAYTGDQNTLDAPHRKGDLRRARAAALNIVPNSTGAAKAIGLVIPELNGKLDGSAQRVPVATGSLTELVSVLERPVTKEEINAAMKAAANESYGYTEDQIVSSDVVGIEYGSLFDATQTRVMTVGDKQLVKTVAWYDNEMSYTCQLVRTLEYFAGKI